MKIQIFWIILGIAFFLYGVMILAIRSGTAFFLAWFALGGLCFLAAFLAHIRLWSRLPGPTKIAAVLILAACLVVFVVTEIRIASGFGQKGENDLDAIVVLGAQVHTNGPSVVLKYRLDAAYYYLTENEDTVCIVSGGQGFNEPFPEADGMKAYLTERGIPEERIIKEDASLDTSQNIRNSLALLESPDSRVGIVTNNFHVYRACALAKKAGMTNACGIAAGCTPFYLPNNMFREFFGVWKDLLAGNI